MENRAIDNRRGLAPSHPDKSGAVPLKGASATASRTIPRASVYALRLRRDMKTQRFTPIYRGYRLEASRCGGICIGRYREPVQAPLRDAKYTKSRTVASLPPSLRYIGAKARQVGRTTATSGRRDAAGIQRPYFEERQHDRSLLHPTVFDTTGRSNRSFTPSGAKGPQVGAATRYPNLYGEQKIKQNNYELKSRH
jgi:hypothetical protein